MKICSNWLLHINRFIPEIFFDQAKKLLLKIYLWVKHYLKRSGTNTW
jgi:hypothetical protein